MLHSERSKRAAKTLEAVQELLGRSVNIFGLDAEAEPQLAHRFQPSGAELLVTFRSDFSNTESGFLFGWTTELEGEPPLAAGTCARGCERAMVGDGTCDRECMNAGCGWDGAEGQHGGDCDATCEGLEYRGRDGVSRTRRAGSRSSGTARATPSACPRGATTTTPTASATGC